MNSNQTDSTNTTSALLNGVNYYSVDHPETGDLILVTFNSQEDAFFGNLVEFPDYRCIMNYQDVTKKRKVKSWAKIVPMNKVLVVKVDDIDTDKKIVQVSMAYLGDKFKEDLTNIQLQEKLMEPFNENKTMENFIKSLCIVNHFDYKTIWTSLVYHIDELRRDDDDDDDTLSLWSYFSNNFNDLDDWIETCELNKNIGDAIKELYGKITKETPKKITSKIGIISIGGIDATKKLISGILLQLKYNYNFRYETTPYYLFETSTEDSDYNSHDKFIKMLETESVKFNPKIFIKTDFVGKISAN